MPRLGMVTEPIEIITIRSIEDTTKIKDRQKCGKPFNPEALATKNGGFDLQRFLW